MGDKLRNRILVSTFGLICGILGMCLIVGLPLSNKKGRLGGYYLTQATAMPFVAFLSLISTNVVSNHEFLLRLKIRTIVHFKTIANWNISLK